jgi:large subunit ribosomal protein L15
MKLHDLRPPAGSNTVRTRVGRGIAAGKGKTAGRGTKGQKARAGGSIPPWFEGGQTPLHMRIPKLRGFKNRGKVDYEIVNVGDIAARVDAGAFTAAGTTPKKGEQLTINADILRAVGLVRDVRKPLKVLGGGDLATALFVVADAFTKSATSKIESAGGTVNVLEVPVAPTPALGVDGEPRAPRQPRTAAGRAAADSEARARSVREADASERAAEAEATSARKAKSEAPADDGEKPAKAERSERSERSDRPARGEKRAAPVAAAETPTADDAGESAGTADAVEATDVADTAADEAAPTSDEPADAPDAVAETADDEPVPGDDLESDASVPGDDA